jgi:hypothetical protein
MQPERLKGEADRLDSQAAARQGGDGNRPSWRKVRLMGRGFTDENTFRALDPMRVYLRQVFFSPGPPDPYKNSPGRHQEAGFQRRGQD